jgi:hypothetical protein
MKVIEDRKGERGLRPFHCGRKQLGSNELIGVRYIVAATIINANTMNPICMDDDGVAPRHRETVLTLLPTMAQMKHGTD